MQMKKKLPLFGLALGVLLTAGPVFSQNDQPNMVEEVLAGTRREARASWWGYDANDSTERLQAAINSGVPRLIIDKMAAGPWITQPLKLVSNQEVVFEEGAELQALRGAFKGRNDSLLNLQYIENVTLLGLGAGATLRMFKADYHTEAYEKAEWRHGISMRGTRNVRIENLSIIDSGGDGIYLGASKGRYCTDTVISKVICDGNNRQGISVIAAINLLIEDTIMRNTWGTAPQAGIDFEPNHEHEPLINCVMRNCITENNAGDGYEFYLPNMDTQKHGATTIILENCISRGDKRRAFGFITRTRRTPKPAMAGLVKVINCTFEDSGSPAIAIDTKADDELEFEFTNLTIRNCGVSSSAPITIGTHNYKDGAPLPGKISFTNVTVEDSAERPFLKYSDHSLGGHYPNHVTGAITVVRDGQKTTQALTQEWLKATFPSRIVRRLPSVDLSSAVLTPVQAAPAAQQFKGLRFRRGGEFLVYANEGEAIEVTAYYGKLAKLGGKTEKVVLTSPKGVKTELGEIDFQSEKTFTLAAAPETGIYRLLIPGGGNWVELRASNRPIAKAGTVDFATTIGDAFFHVPVGTPEFAIHLWGEGGEGCKVTILDPTGNKVWEKDNVTEIEQFFATPQQAAQSGAWRIRLDRASEAFHEDFHVELYGVPSLLSPAPELTITVKK
ncbi:MAG: right-handed parallel beta-helix repeat-containing protein [Lentisphaeria bacterium]|nr:right-handed parallel beta-helix repeat-containing protein [Lentisphaeria bacterium]